MRKRFQSGSVKKSSDGRYWVCQYREDAQGKRVNRSRIVGKVSRMTKTDARKLAADIVKPINERASFKPSTDISVKDFVEKVFLPFCRRGKWKSITDKVRTDSITRHVVEPFGSRQLRSLTRDEMQQHLDDRKHLAFTTVDHLRWDVKSIFDMAVAEGVVPTNPIYVMPGTMLIFVPRECPKPKRPAMTFDQVKKAVGALDLRERLVLKLGILAGMRQSEIFGIRRGRAHIDYIEVVERVSRRDIDTPKTAKSFRKVALSSEVQRDLCAWLDSTSGGLEDWLFPSENSTMPIGADNMMARYIRPRLKEIDLGWVDYRVLRRTHSSLMKEKGVDPKVIADQQGHGVDVNVNVYTQTSLEIRREAAETLASAFVN